MICATKRGMRRRAMLLGSKKGTPSLAGVAGHLDKTKAPFGVDGLHTRIEDSARVLASVVERKGVVTLGFRHPTKKATRGRWAFLRASVAALQAKTA